MERLICSEIGCDGAERERPISLFVLEHPISLEPCEIGVASVCVFLVCFLKSILTVCLK